MNLEDLSLLAQVEDAYTEVRARVAASGQSLVAALNAEIDARGGRNQVTQISTLHVMVADHAGFRCGRALLCATPELRVVAMLMRHISRFQADENSVEVFNRDCVEDLRRLTEELPRWRTHCAKLQEEAKSSPPFKK